MAKRNCHKHYNANRETKTPFDDLVRAVATAAEVSCRDVFKYVCEFAVSYPVPADPATIATAYLDEALPRRSPMYTDSDGNEQRLTVQKLAERAPHETFLIMTSKGVTVLKKGVNLDVWDAADSEILVLWQAPN